MPSEGERKEGNENPEQDPFEHYAEELAKKYPTLGSSDEYNQDEQGQDQAIARQTTESPQVERTKEKDEFEAYAKELQEKYAEEEESADAVRAGQNDSQDASKTQERHGQTEDANPSENRETNSGPEEIPANLTDASQSIKSNPEQAESDTFPSERASEEADLQDTNQAQPRVGDRKSDELQGLPTQTAPGELRGTEEEPARENKDSTRTKVEVPNLGKDIGPYEERAILTTMAEMRSQQRREGTGNFERHSNTGNPRDFELARAIGSDSRVQNAFGDTKNSDIQDVGKPVTQTQDSPELGKEHVNPPLQRESQVMQERAENSQDFRIPAAVGFTDPNRGTETRRADPLSSVESGEYVANVPVRAVRNGEGKQYFPVFNIFKVHIEEQTGIKLNKGGFYHVVGNIEGVCDFDVHRIIKTHFRIMTPLEHRDKVEFGKVYNVHIKSIEEMRLNEKQREIVANSVGVQYRPLMYRLQRADENPKKTELHLSRTERIVSPRKDYEIRIVERLENIGAMFRLKAHLHTRRDDRRYFTLPNTAFEQKIGLKLEEMRDYVIKGEIQGVGEFRKILERCAARQDVPIYVPSKLSRSIEVGREYVVKIDLIEKLQRPKPWEGIKLDEMRPWSWKEVASWVDTEGAVCCPTEKGSNYQILISQKEKQVLAEIAYFLNQQGLRSSLKLARATGVYNLHILGAEIEARVIKEIEPFIRTENKITQISEFKKSICRPRKTLWPSIKNAREILGLTDKSS